MRRILCFGDSNTWGMEPVSGKRYETDTRWPRVMQTRLGAEYEIIEEGLCGRTTVWDDPIEEYRNGIKYLIPCLISHLPLDLVIIMLGTNDLKSRFSVSANEIALSAAKLVHAVRTSTCGYDGKDPEALLVAPPPIHEKDNPILTGGQAKSEQFGKVFGRIARNRGYRFFDAGTVIQSSRRDGVHLEPDAHRALAEVLETQAREILET